MTFALVLAAGVLLAGGVVALAAGAGSSAPALEAALTRAGGGGPTNVDRRELEPLTSRSERLGAQLYRRSPLPLTSAQQRALKLQNKSVAEFYADKAVMAVIGALLPAVVAVAGFVGAWVLPRLG